ncbi:MAG: hypothetical protein WCY93_10160 [Anaerolineaceae bacterium]
MGKFNAERCPPALIFTDNDYPADPFGAGIFRCDDSHHLGLTPGWVKLALRHGLGEVAAQQRHKAFHYKQPPG